MAVVVHVLHGIAAVLLTLFGVAVGAVVVAKDSTARPKFLEVLLAPTVAAVILFLSINTSQWLALVLGIVCGFVSSAITRLMSIWIEDGNRKASIRPTVVNSRTVWRRFLYAVGNYQSRLVLSLFYFTIVAPFALIDRLTQDPFCLREREETSYWRSRTSSDDDLSRPY